MAALLQCQEIAATNHFEETGCPQWLPCTSARLNGSVIQECDELKLLGITLTPGLNWSTHIDNIKSSASRVYGAICRSSNCFTERSRANLYKSLILPVVDYCSPIWAGSHTTHLNGLDKLQQKCRRLFPSIAVDNLNHRRKVSSLTLLYQIAHGLVPACLDFLRPPPLPRLLDTRQSQTANDLSFLLPASRTEQHQLSFMPSTLRLWHELPASVVYQSTTNKFKSAVNHYLKHA